jgi:hypothetical protein
MYAFTITKVPKSKTPKPTEKPTDNRNEKYDK